MGQPQAVCVRGKKRPPQSMTSNSVVLQGNQNVSYRVLAIAIRDKVDISDLWLQADCEGEKRISKTVRFYQH